MVSAFYNDLATLYIKIFVDNQSILTSTAQTLLGDDQGEKSVDALFQDLFLAPFALSSLGGDAAAAVGGLLSALIGAGLDASGDDSFSGTWSAAQDRFTELSQRNQDAIIAGSAFVAGDAGFLQYVAQQKDSGAWDPGDDWVRRSTTSEGLRQMTRWTYQTLTPVIWKINAIYSHFGCTKPDDEIYNYFVDDNAHQDCYRQIQVGLPAHAPADQLHNILDPVSSECTATELNTVTWAYGTCSVGVPKEDFFLNRNGWRFAVNHTCPGCSAPP